MKWPSTLKRGQQRELIELIESRIVFMYGKLEKGIDPYILPSSKYGCNEAFYEKEDESGVAGGFFYIPPTCGTLGNELVSWEHDARTYKEK